MNSGELFDFGSDPELEARFVARIASRLRACEAQPEQFTRLGIQPEEIPVS